MFDFDKATSDAPVGHLDARTLEKIEPILRAQQEYLDGGDGEGRYKLRMSMLFAITMTWVETFAAEHDGHSPASCARRSVNEAREQVVALTELHPDLAEVGQVHLEAIDGMLAVLDLDDEARQAE